MKTPIAAIVGPGTAWGGQAACAGQRSGRAGHAPNPRPARIGEAELGAADELTAPNEGRRLGARGRRRPGFIGTYRSPFTDDRRWSTRRHA